MPFTAEQIRNCPVAVIERQYIAAMDVYDAAQRKLFENPNTPCKAELEAEMAAAEARREALEEAITHTKAISRAGLTLQLVHLGMEFDTALDDAEDGVRDGDAASRVRRLIDLLRHSIASADEPRAA
jgi:hypothetical protein